MACRAVWHNDNPVDVRKPFGSVKVFKLCQGRVGWGCLQSGGVAGWPLIGSDLGWRGCRG
ncbi:hypothetical protein GCM10027161_32540 [Microbispora hainanensis]